jgi:hypothetical protein
MGHNQPANLISISEMSPRQEIENKICENGVVLDGFHHLKLKKYIENLHICMLFFQCIAMNIKKFIHELFFKPSYSQI